MATNTQGGSADLNKTLALLHQHTGVDFTHYKEATLRRRIERRITARKLGSLTEYGGYLRSHPAEISELFNDLLIQVTSFFRDPLVFKSLKTNYFSHLVRETRADGAFRIWVPACSTGEEVYSLAIMLAELNERKKEPREVQVFGTDVNEMVLEKARAGFYPAAIQKQVSSERLRRFFEPVPGGFQISKSIRDLCIFARHNLAMDPPFSNLDLISCRNLLIYLVPALQAKIMPVFHFALKPDGMLLLGASETAGRSSDLFFVRDRKLNLFGRKTLKAKTIPGPLQPAAVRRSMPPAIRNAAARLKQKLNLSQLEAQAKKIAEDLGGRPDNEPSVVPITIPKTGQTAYLVLVEPREDRKTGKTPRTAPATAKNKDVEIARLRRQLFTVRKSLESIIEQQEAANEEVRAANEEVVSSNEELQSTNEELETAREELQATNEELAMLNNELEKRNEELEKANIISGHFKALVESSDDAIISKDLNGVIQTWNRGAERIFGYTAPEVVGKPVTILIPPENPNEEPEILARLRAGHRIDHYETIRRRKDGQLIDISLTVSPVKNSSGQVVGGSKIARDITEKKQAESELKHARDEAEQASRAKDDFLATLSHELRTPLNPVLLVASDAAADLDLSPGVRANFDLIRRNVELEARLIDDLLDLARVRSGKLKVEKRQVNIHSVLSATIAMVQNEIEHKKLRLIQKLHDAQCVISGDNVRLQQIFWNVLKNAIKFTPVGGEITVETRTTGGHYVVRISDTGLGMSDRELTRAFDAFKQGDHSEDTRRFGGLGLGLTISKNLVELHSGTIEASSHGRGRGSTFVIRLPIAKWLDRSPGAGSPSDSMNPGQNNHRLNILLVEDHEPTRITLARLLMNRHHKVTQAASGAEALAVAKKSRFDLVISDIGLPDDNGYELFKKLLKHLPKTKGIALTGYGMDKDLEHSKNSGFQAHLTKPVRIEALELALANLGKE